MKVIGLTGGIGAGKTQILNYLNDKYGASICQADEVAKKLQKKGAPVYDEIVAHFGEEILDEKGEINRSKLADIVFADEKELKILNGIVHPAVKEEIRRKIAAEERKCTSLFLIEAALLIEDNYEEICDEFWYVYTKPEIRRQRMKETRNYSDEKVDSVMRNQQPDEVFFEQCSFVIKNNTTLSDVYAQLKEKLDQQ